MHNDNVVDHTLSYNVPMETRERKVNDEFSLLLSQTHEALYADTLAQNPVSNMNPSYQASDFHPQISKHQNIYTSETRYYYVTELEHASQTNCTESTNRQSDTQESCKYTDCFIAPQYISETQNKSFEKHQMHVNESLFHGNHNAVIKASSGDSNYQTIAHLQQFNSDNNNHHFERQTNYSHSSTDFENVTNSSSLSKSTITPNNTTANFSPNINQMKDTTARNLNQSQNLEVRRNAMTIQHRFPGVTHNKLVTCKNITVGKQDSDAADKSQYFEKLFEKTTNLNSHKASTFESFANSNPLDAPTKRAGTTMAYLTPTLKQMRDTMTRRLSQSQSFKGRKNAVAKQRSFPKTIDDKLMTNTNNTSAKEQKSDLIDNSRCKETYNEILHVKFDTPISALHKGMVNNDKYFVSMLSFNEREISTSGTQRITSIDHKLSQNISQYEENTMFYSLKSCTNSNRLKFNKTNALSSRTRSNEVSFNEKAKNIGASDINESCCCKYFSNFNEKDSCMSNCFDIENLIRIAKSICGCSLKCICDCDRNSIPLLSRDEAILFKNASPGKRKWPDEIFKNTDSSENFPQLGLPNNTVWKAKREKRSLPSEKLSAGSANMGIKTANIDTKESSYYRKRSASKENDRTSLLQSSKRKKNTAVAETSNFTKKLVKIFEVFCSHCGKQFTHISLPKDPSSLQNIHVSNFFCEFCLKVSCSQECFQNHKLTHAQCSYKINKCPTLKQHLLEQNITGKKQESCAGNVCKNSSKDKENKQLNVINYNREKSHSCDECHKCFSRKEHLIRHKLSHSKKKLLLPDKKPVCCEVCHKIFCTKLTLNRHLRRMHSVELQDI